MKTLITYFSPAMFARFVWNMFHCTFNTPDPPKCMGEIGEWVNDFMGYERVAVKICLAAIFWTL